MRDPERNVVFSEHDVVARGRHTVHLPAGLELKSAGPLALEIYAKRPGTAESQLRAELPLAAPLYVTHLTTDKPMYQPGETVRLLTNLLDLEAWVIGTLYQYRWQVELFFRWLKVYAHFEHLLSESRPGILLSFYVAVIGVLLVYLHTGAQPSKYAFSLLGLVANGAATVEEIVPILAERERRIALERARLTRRRTAQSRAG